MYRTISQMARVAAVAVVLVGLYASWQIARLVGDLAALDRGVGGSRALPSIGAFLVSLLFFACLAILLWIGAAALDAIDELHGKVDDVRHRQELLAGRTAETLNAALRAGPGVGTAVAAEAVARPAAAIAPVPRTTLSVAATDPAPEAPRECRIEEQGGPYPALRAVGFRPDGGSVVVDDESFSRSDLSRSRSQALQLLTARLAADGWEPVPQGRPGDLPRFRRPTAN